MNRSRTRNSITRWRALGSAGLALAAVAAIGFTTIAPANAAGQDWRHGHDWRGQDWRHGQVWREHDWRRQHWRPYGYGFSYSVPAYGYAYPHPSYYAYPSYGYYGGSDYGYGDAR